ncbi:winged helix-turn-helix domain-containing protein [Variovorax sp. dw_954]|uniref:winged helix-turn-helix domain-containing protein n=1 Tax=Variovorax sp. dw_954 TaxID=2720078 RepID=UPI0031F703F1
MGLSRDSYRNPPEVDALASTPATGRPAKLTIKQQEQVFRWINGRDPRQYGLDFGLWTRQIAATLIEQKFSVKLGVTAEGRLLARWGMSPQKPLQRAYQRDPQAIERWQRETYPGIAAAARQTEADVYFWDESGFRADTVHGKTWPVRGKTPVVERPGQRARIHRFNQWQAHHAHLARLRTRPEPGRAGVESCQANRRGP